MILLAARSPLAHLLTVATAAVLGVELADILGLLKSHNFASACGAVAATAAMGLNLWNGRKDRRLRDLQDLTVTNRFLIESQGETIEGLGRTVEREQTARLVIQVELAQISEELLRRDNVLAAHSGAREPIRGPVPAEAIDVLVVDDSVLVLKAMVRVLERYGFRVEVARCIAEARTQIAARDAAHRRYDFAIFDLVMPDATIDDVIDLTCAIHQGTDVVIMTGISDEAVLDRAKACAAKVLVKPIDLYELLAHLGYTRAEDGP